MNERLVVLRALGLGDLLTAVPALRALREHFPEHHMTLATSAPMAPLGRLLDITDDVVAVEELGELPESLRGAEVAVNLHGSGPQSHRVLMQTEPKRLIAFGNDVAGFDGPRWRADEHEVVRWCRLLVENGIAADPTRLHVSADEDPKAANATLLHPGAAAPSRRWPVERWTAVARAEVAKGRRVILTGGPSEVDLCAAVAHQAGLDESCILAGRLSLEELIATVAAADRVVVGDTGVAHVATAVKTPSVVLFGPVSPAQWGPPTHPRHIALWAGLAGDPHGQSLDPGLDLITVEQVLDALDRLADTVTADRGAA